MTGLASLWRTLVFGACAAALTPIGVTLLAPFLGSVGALSAWLIAVSAAYLAGLAKRPSTGLAAALALALPGLVLAVFGARPQEMAVLSALLIGVLRSGLLRRDTRPGTSFARAFAIESSLVGMGLLVAAWLARGSFFPLSFAIWGFFLVQGAFFLVGGPAARAARDTPPADVDPFEAAQRRALALLDDSVAP